MGKQLLQDLGCAFAAAYVELGCVKQSAGESPRSDDHWGPAPSLRNIASGTDLKSPSLPTTPRMPIPGASMSWVPMTIRVLIAGHLRCGNRWGVTTVPRLGRVGIARPLACTSASQAAPDVPKDGRGYRDGPEPSPTPSLRHVTERAAEGLAQPYSAMCTFAAARLLLVQLRIPALRPGPFWWGSCGLP